MSRRGTEANNRLVDAVLPRLASLPNVVTAAGASAAPFMLLPQRIAIVLEGRPASEQHDALRQVVTADYFATMGIRRVNGRLFGSDDRYGTHAAVVSRAFEVRFFPDGAVGRRFRYRWGTDSKLAFDYVVVGVVENVKRQDR
jgi:hypothetical protein